MVFPLLSLPIQLFDAILSYGGLSQTAMYLWLSGDIRMQRQLQGITSVALSDPNRHSLARFCSFILQLPKLRRLVLDRSENKLFKSDIVGDMVKRLPTSLTELRFTFANSSASLADEYVQNISSLYEDDVKPHRECSWSLSSAFPQLSVLEMGLSSSFSVSTLPHSLTTLVLYLRLNLQQDVPFYPNLPRQLLNLELHGEVNSEQFRPIRDLPPTLTSFIPYYRANNHFFTCENLPSSLTYLDPMTAFVNTRGDLMKLPPTMTAMGRLFTEEFDCYEEIGTVMPNLRSLDLDEIQPSQATPSMIRSLPSTLTKLLLRTDLEHLVPTDWPQSLKKLKLYRNSLNFRVDALPLNLTRLWLERANPVTAADISRLPRSLLRLNCYVKENIDECDFPPMLSHLGLYELSLPLDALWVDMERQYIEIECTEEEIWQQNINDHYLSEDRKTARIPLNSASIATHRFLEGEKVAKCFPFASLPRSITQLRTNAIIPASQLKHLPPRLKDLSSYVIFKDAEYLPNDSAEINAMHSIMRIGEGEGVKEKFDWQQLASTSISSLLPRTLQEIVVSWFFSPGHQEIRHLPPNLSQVQIQAPRFHTWDRDSLSEFLKLEKLTRLDINAEELTDEQCEAVPPTLIEMVVGRLDVTMHGALSYPLGLLSFATCNKNSLPLE